MAWTATDTVALAPGLPGSFDHIIYSVSVIKHGDQYFMYYTTSRTGDTVAIALATSADGVLWQKHLDSPVVKSGPAGSWDFPNAVGGRIAVVNDTFYMVYSGAVGANQELGLATSTDGIEWTKSPRNPILSPGSPASVDAHYVGAAGLCYRDNRFYLVYRAENAYGADSYSLATSSDGTQWQKFEGNPIYPSGRLGWDAASVGGGTLLWANGRFKYWYCGTPDFNGWSIGLASIQEPGMIRVWPDELDFGWVRTNTTDKLFVQIANAAGNDSLHITSITSNDSAFALEAGPTAIAAGDSLLLPIRYGPTAARSDSGMITIMSDDSRSPEIFIYVYGRGYTLMNNPVIKGITVVPNSYYQARIIWFRSLGDSVGAVDPVTQYSIWRRVSGTNTMGSAVPPNHGPTLSSTATDGLWDYVATVPAAELNEYGYVAPILVDYHQLNAYTTFLVAAHTRDLQVYQSTPDSVQYNPSFINGVDPDTKLMPNDFVLYQNYPNPFNPSTTIRFGLPQRSHVLLSVFSVLGQKVAELVNGDVDAGVHEIRFDGRGLASGIYFYRLQTEGFAQTKTFLLVR